MKLVELTNTKGGVVWVNASHLLYVCLADGAGGSLYGADAEASVASKLHFVHGSTMEVKQALADVVARLNA